MDGTLGFLIPLMRKYTNFIAIPRHSGNEQPSLVQILIQLCSQHLQIFPPCIRLLSSLCLRRKGKLPYLCLHGQRVQTSQKILLCPGPCPICHKSFQQKNLRPIRCMHTSRVPHTLHGRSRTEAFPIISGLPRLTAVRCLLRLLPPAGCQIMLHPLLPLPDSVTGCLFIAAADSAP